MATNKERFINRPSTITRKKSILWDIRSTRKAYLIEAGWLQNVVGLSRGFEDRDYNSIISLWALYVTRWNCNIKMGIELPEAALDG